MRVAIGVDIVQEGKLWKALVTSYAALGKAEAEAATIASMKIAARAVPMIALTVAPVVEIAIPVP